VVTRLLPWQPLGRRRSTSATHVPEGPRGEGAGVQDFDLRAPNGPKGWRPSHRGLTWRRKYINIKLTLDAKSKINLWEFLLNRLTVPAVVVAIGAASAVAWSQTPASNPNVKTYYITPLENDASRIVRLRAIAFPAKADSGFHRHPGDQWNTVEEGEVTWTIKGKEPRTFKVGESAYIPRGTIHRSQNLTDKPARVIELNIMDKDKPDVERLAE
jgi:quercetin dioxygenase-like cupin family protein